MVISNKKAWVKIAEVGIAFILISFALFTSINKEGVGIFDISSKISETEISILKEIKSNESMRSSLLNAETLPIQWDDFSALGLSEINTTLSANIPTYLNCEAKICYLNDSCLFYKSVHSDVYAESVIVSSNLKKYNPRQLKIFCWKK